MSWEICETILSWEDFMEILLDVKSRRNSRTLLAAWKTVGSLIEIGVEDGDVVEPISLSFEKDVLTGTTTVTFQQGIPHFISSCGKIFLDNGDYNFRIVK